MKHKQNSAIFYHIIWASFQGEFLKIYINVDAKNMDMRVLQNLSVKYTELLVLLGEFCSPQIHL